MQKDQRVLIQQPNARITKNFLETVRCGQKQRELMQAMVWQYRRGAMSSLPDAEPKKFGGSHL